MNGNTIKYHTSLGIQENSFTRIVSFQSTKVFRDTYGIAVESEDGIHLLCLFSEGDSVTYQGRTYTYGRDLDRLEMAWRNTQNMEAIKDL